MPASRRIIRRDEVGAISGQTGNPHEVWYRYGGRQLGYAGNNGTARVDTAASIYERQAAAPTAEYSGTFRHGRDWGYGYADFAQSYDPISSYSQGSGGGGYVVQAGDTLASIAQAVYGDANLWYKIAGANGMASGEGGSLNFSR